MFASGSVHKVGWNPGKVRATRWRQAFTLVELLTVISIIAILSAILMPAAMAARAMAYQYGAMQALGQLGTAASMYASDNDETFMPALYSTGPAIQAWFGLEGSDGKYDPRGGLLAGYTGGKRLADVTFTARDYFGDHSGFGYNWAYLGSNFGLDWDLSSFPNCQNEARVSDLQDPSSIIVLATSSFYFATWLPKGDGFTYDFGIIDAPSYWHGNPNVDFRHGGNREPDPSLKVVFSTGKALAVFADGHSAAKKQTQLTDSNFVRG